MNLFYWGLGIGLVMGAISLWLGLDYYTAKIELKELKMAQKGKK